ncbi:general stress protein [Kineococcus sp. R86509]|uniref:general stress protein n=1 Tax=Kineococcus sp. R86509 TaxID=3093851 RepID=UPI0036D2E1A8
MQSKRQNVVRNPTTRNRNSGGGLRSIAETVEAHEQVTAVRSALVQPYFPFGPEQTSLGAHTTYAEARTLVDELARRDFEVERTQIVGTDLRMVEQITGRMDWPRAVASGAISGAWFGLFVGVLLVFLSGEDVLRSMLFGVAWGVVFGIVLSCVRYGMTRGRRDFRSRSTIEPTRFEVLVDSAYLARALDVLAH